MTNKPLLCVTRELLEEMLSAMKETHSLPARFYGSTLGDRVRSILESQGEPAEPLTIGTLHRDCDERIVFKSAGEVHIKDGMQVYAEPQQAGPFTPDTVVCRRYQMAQYPGQDFYHYDIEPYYDSVPVTLSELIRLAKPCLK